LFRKISFKFKIEIGKSSDCKNMLTLPKIPEAKTLSY